jgi:CBS domain-containing protein
MDVRELMTSEPAVCLAADSLAAVGALMARRRCGFIPVVESRESLRVAGVLTDRDVALHLARTDRPAAQVPAGECMTREPATIGPDANLTEAAELMERLAIHRLPVVDGGRLVGILSLKDIAIAARGLASSAGPNVAERQLVDIIEAIAAAQQARGAREPAAANPTGRTARMV